MQKLYNVQAMRGIASMMVCFIHAIALPVGVGMEHVAPLWSAVGPAGVDLFFVISGFIISTVAVSTCKNALKRGGFDVAREFAMKRLARIYPVYWVVFILACLVAPYVWLAPETVPQVPLWRLFFLIDVNNYRVMAAWTLVYELYFYLIVTIIVLIMPTKIFKGLTIWSGGTIAIILSLEVLGIPRNFTVPISPLLIEFMLGVGVGYLVNREKFFSPIGAISTGVILFAMGAYENSALEPWQPWTRTICFGPGAALILYGVVAAELQTGWTFSRPWQKLGDASYSIYIWHQLLFFTALSIAQRIGLFKIVPGPIYVAITIVAVVGFGFFSYKFFENPVRWRLERYASVQRSGQASRQMQWTRNAALACAVIALPLLAAFTSSSPSSAGKGATMVDANSAAPRIELKVGAFVWPRDEGHSPLVFNNDGVLASPGAIELPQIQGNKRRLYIQLKGEAAGGLYVGYKQDGKTVEKWHNFLPGNKVLSIDLPSKTDDEIVWLVRDMKRGALKIEKLAIQDE